eukprot:COSAG01_NODE_7220_length_3299_cov_5.706875_2_plen_62_part_00
MRVRSAGCEWVEAIQAVAARSARRELGGLRAAYELRIRGLEAELASLQKQQQQQQQQQQRY